MCSSDLEFYSEGELERNKLKRIKECMRFRKIGVHEVMKDKVMEDGLQHKDGLGVWKEKGEQSRRKRIFV